MVGLGCLVYMHSIVNGVHRKKSDFISGVTTVRLKLVEFAGLKKCSYSKSVNCIWKRLKKGVFRVCDHLELAPKV
jgi:hypothetical protein